MKKQGANGNHDDQRNGTSLYGIFLEISLESYNDETNMRYISIRRPIILQWKNALELAEEIQQTESGVRGQEEIGSLRREEVRVLLVDYRALYDWTNDTRRDRRPLCVCCTGCDKTEPSVEIFELTWILNTEPGGRVEVEIRNAAWGNIYQRGGQNDCSVEVKLRLTLSFIFGGVHIPELIELASTVLISALCTCLCCRSCGLE